MGVNHMKIFGISIVTILIVLLAYWLGMKRMIV